MCCSAGDTGRQPNVDNISPIDTKAPMSISRPGVSVCRHALGVLACVCVLVLY